jgi:hypothetical protein
MTWCGWYKVALLKAQKEEWQTFTDTGTVGELDRDDWGIAAFRTIYTRADVYRFSFFPRTIITWNSIHCTTRCTVNGHKYSPPSILRHIFHIKPHFQKNYCEVISKWILIIFAPEEAEIFKDYLLFQHDFLSDCLYF